MLHMYGYISRLFNFVARIILTRLILFLNSVQETMVTMNGQAEGARVNAWKRSSWPRPPKVYARTSPFFFFLRRVLFRHYSEDRNAGVQLRLPVTRRIGPAVDNAATSRVAEASLPPVCPPPLYPVVVVVVVVILSCPFFSTREALYPRQRSSPTTWPLHDACL